MYTMIAYLNSTFTHRIMITVHTKIKPWDNYNDDRIIKGKN